MKFIFAQMMALTSQRRARRNLKFVSGFLLVFVSLIIIYSILFHVLMEMEGRDYSMVTGLYWALTVMSTLGFGDITFTSDPGMIFTIVVLLSGIFCFMLMLPFTFMRFIFSPLMEAQTSSATPRKLPPDTKGHVIIVGHDYNAQSISRHLEKHGIEHVLLVADSQLALSLYDAGFRVVVGELDIPATYINMQVHQAAMVIALDDDMKNTNIASTVREVDADVQLVARIRNSNSHDILELAGANHVYYFARMLGSFLARRVFSKRISSNIIGRFEGFCIAEAPAGNTSLAGKSLRESNLRSEFGLNLAGIWQGNDYMVASPETIIDDGAVLLLVGTEQNLARYDAANAREYAEGENPVLILGGGTVGKAVAEKLEARHIPHRIVEKNTGPIPVSDARYIHGDAADIEVLKAAGIDTTETVLVTTHDDDVNIYLTIYCRKLRPDIQIISRANLDRNVGSLYSAGANLVVSQASIMATSIINLMIPGRVFMLTQGLNIFKLPVPGSLIGKNLINSNIRNASLCNVVAVKTPKGVRVPPDPLAPLSVEDELILIGSEESETKFMEQFGQ